MPTKIDEVGNRYGRLVVVEQAANSKHGHRCWNCQCDCGNKIVTLGISLRAGKTRSCGCWARELSYKHGLCDHPLYNTWVDIRRRCLNSKHKHYKSYGGRGIKLYEQWVGDVESFIMWIEENLGPRPLDHSLDRIDNDGNYEPGNLRWATQKTQVANQRYRLYFSEDFYKALTEPTIFEFVPLFD